MCTAPFGTSTNTTPILAVFFCQNEFGRATVCAGGAAQAAMSAVAITKHSDRNIRALANKCCCTDNSLSRAAQMPLQSAVTHPNPGASHHFPGVYQIGEVKA